MDILSNLKHRYNKKDKAHLLVGICGRAGAGKTTLAKKISEKFKMHTIIYSGDWRFKHDSAERKKLFQEKWKAGMNAYMYAINQYTWWDFEKIGIDLDDLLKSKAVIIKNAYDRETGKRDTTIELPDRYKSIILYENCILGGTEILEKLDLIILLNTPDEVCFSRMIDKDFGRRSMAEIASRFLITSFSENKFFTLFWHVYRNLSKN